MAAAAHSTNTSRRLFLAGGPAAAVFAALSVEAAQIAPLPALIESHKAAYLAFTHACVVEDEASEITDPRYRAARAEYVRREEAEYQALMALCEYRPADMVQVRLRGNYLAGLADQYGVLGEDQLIALLRS